MWSLTFNLSPRTGKPAKQNEQGNGDDVGVKHGLNLAQYILRQLVKVRGRGWALLPCHHFLKQ